MFINNLTGVSVTGNVQQTIFVGNTFRTEGILLPPHSAQIGNDGVNLVASDGFAVGTTGVSSGVNTFENLKNGIYALNSNFSVHNARFISIFNQNRFAQDINCGNGIVLYSNCNLIATNSVFQESTVGINSQNSNMDVTGCRFFRDVNLNDAIGVVFGIVANGANGGKINIHSNPEISGAFTGISLIDVSNFSIFKNQISTNKDFFMQYFPDFGRFCISILNCNGSGSKTIFSNSVNSYDTFWGISVSNSSKVKVDGNKIKVLNPPAGPIIAFVAKFGIRTNNSSYCLFRDNAILGPSVDFIGGNGFNVSMSPSCDYCCNSVIDIENGFYFGSGSLGSNLRNTSFASSLKRALRFNTGGIIGIQKNAGNTWSSDYPEYGALHEGMPNVAVLNKFEVTTLGLPLTPVFPTDILPDPSIPGQKWFESVTGGSIESCEDDCGLPLPPGPIPPEDLDPLLFVIAGGDIPTGEPHSATTNWLLRTSLYRNMLENLALPQAHPSLQSFFYTHQTTNTGIYETLRRDIEALSDFTSTEAVAYKNNQDSIIAWLWILTELDSLIWSASPSQIPGLMVEKSTRISALVSLRSPNDNYRSAIQSQKTTLIDQLIARNSALSTNEVFYENEKTCNEVFLNTIAKGIYTLTTQQVAQLSPIAEQCAFSGGRAVYQARGMYQMHIDTIFFDACGGTIPYFSAGLKEGLLEEIDFSFSPNPAHLYVTVSILRGNPTEFILSDLMGKTVSSIVVPENERQLLIPLEELSAGCYFLSARSGNAKSTISKKMLINR